MTPRKRYAFWIDSEQQERLEQVRERDGILPSEQIRRALDDWLTKKVVKVKAPSRSRGKRQRKD